MFFTYGLSNSGSTLNSNKGRQGSPSVRKPSSWQESSSKSQERGAYRPPHLRGKPQASRSIQVGSSDAFTGDCDGQGAWGGASSDSEQSDSDAHHEEGDRFKSSKVRTNAILTIQVCSPFRRIVCRISKFHVQENEVHLQFSDDPEVFSCILHHS